MSDIRSLFSISYSARKRFKSCPKSYYYRYVVKDPTKDDPLNTMYGSIIGKIFEWFYERRFWTQKDPVRACLDVIPEAMNLVFLKESYIKESNPGYERKLLMDLETFIPHGVNTIKQYKFLTPLTRTEADLSVIHKVDSERSIKLVGFADFIHGTDNDSIFILDGKASKYRDKYVDSEQLIWYALSHYLKYSVAPKQLGFIFWSFPDDPVTWISYDSDSMRMVLSDTINICNRIRDKDFAPVTSGHCYRCTYKNICADGQQYMSKRKIENGGRITNSMFDLESI